MSISPLAGNRLLPLLTIAAVALTAPTGLHAREGAAKARAESPNAAKNGYVEANGMRYYYEIHGAGEPLLLLHGGLGSIDMFGPVLPILTEGRQVIGGGPRDGGHFLGGEAHSRSAPPRPPRLP